MTLAMMCTRCDKQIASFPRHPLDGFCDCGGITAVSVEGGSPMPCQWPTCGGKAGTCQCIAMMRSRLSSAAAPGTCSSERMALSLGLSGRRRRSADDPA